LYECKLCCLLNAPHSAAGLSCSNFVGHYLFSQDGDQGISVVVGKKMYLVIKKHMQKEVLIRFRGESFAYKERS